MTDQKLFTALVRAAFNDGYQMATSHDISSEDLDSVWDRSASRDDLTAYFAALPQPSGPVVERMEEAVREIVRINRIGGEPEYFKDALDKKAKRITQAALSIVLAEIKTVRQWALSDLPEDFAGENAGRMLVHSGGVAALDRLTARLKGESHD